MKFSDIDLLTLLERDEYAPLRRSLHTRRCEKHAIVYHPRERENVIFVVVSGRVRVYLSYDDKEFTLAILERGDVYSSHTRAYVQALDEAELLVGDVRLFGRSLAHVPTFTQTMVRILGHMLGSAFGIIESLAFKDANSRLLELMVETAERNGVEENGGVRFAVGLTVEQISQVVGTSRQTVSTLLNEIVRTGRIEKRGRDDYFIPDPGAIRRTLDNT